jgi:tetratricopeptide (TPR) repeat protein
VTADLANSLATVEGLLRTGRLPEARAALLTLVGGGSGARNAVVDLADRLTDSQPAGAAVCVETAADAWAAEGEFATAAAVLQEFSQRVPGQVPTLLRLVEICVEGGLDTAMQEAQAQLADAYLDGGRAEEARIVAEDLVALHPNDPGHQERLRRARVLASAPAPAATQEIDLTSLLGDLDTENELPSGDSEVEPLELGRTYLEMGMPDDAVAPLIVAAHNPVTRFEASVMLAGIHRERGDLPQAIEWCERAAAAVSPDVDGARALLYDLGDLLEVSGEGARALAVFLEIESSAPAYRDVAARVQRLTRAGEGG